HGSVPLPGQCLASHHRADRPGGHFLHRYRHRLHAIRFPEAWDRRRDDRAHGTRSPAQAVGAPGFVQPIPSSASTPARIELIHSIPLSPPATTKQPTIQICCHALSGIARNRCTKYTDDGQPTSTMITTTNNTACSMNATPPYDPAA